MNPGSLIEVLLLAFFVGGGAALGNSIGGTPGSIAGGLLGLLARIGIGLLANRLPVPSCACGAEVPDGFERSEPVAGEVKYTCRGCGRKFEFRGPLWSEKLEDDVLVPRMRRTALGFWKAV